MAVAYSNRPIVTATIDGSTMGSLLSGLDASLVAAGWTSTAVAGGAEYTLTSPQSSGAGNLQAKCRITNSGDTDLAASCARVQFLSLDGARLGRAHTIAVWPGRSYELIAGQCQMFLSLPGYASNTPGPGGAYSHCVCGGIPHLRKDCSADAPPADAVEAWWSSGIDNVTSGDTTCFRNSWYHTRARWSGCYNGDLATGGGQANMLALRAVAHADYDLSFYRSYQKTQWMDQTAIFFDPLLLWGTGVDPANGLAKVRGQVWDAVLGSKDAPLGDEIVTDEVDPSTGAALGRFHWRNWMHYEGDMSFGAPFSYFASLYLLVSVEAQSDGNYAY